MERKRKKEGVKRKTKRESVCLGKGGGGGDETGLSSQRREGFLQHLHFRTTPDNLLWNSFLREQTVSKAPRHSFSFPAEQSVSSLAYYTHQAYYNNQLSTSTATSTYRTPSPSKTTSTHRTPSLLNHIHSQNTFTL